MKSKLLKLSQILEDLNNPEEAQEIKNFINQPDSVEPEKILYPHDKESKIFKDYERSTPIEGYPSEQEDLELVSDEYYRDLAIQAYLDLFYSGARLLNKLGSGAFSDTFLAQKDGNNIAIKFSKSSKEYLPYLQIKGKRDSIPDELKTLLPIVYEAREITNVDAQSVRKKVISSEGSLPDDIYHFEYKSFIATELLKPIDTGIVNLIYEQDFFISLNKSEKYVIPKIKNILKKWILSWDWNSYSEDIENKNIELIKKILNEKNELIIIASNIYSDILNLKNSEEDLWINDNPTAPEEDFGGSFITGAVSIFKSKVIEGIIDFVEIRLPPRDKNKLIEIKSILSSLTSDSSLNLRIDLLKLMEFFAENFPQYKSYKIKDIKMQGFLDKLNKLRDYGIRWGDIHGNNLMIRETSSSHGYGDLVVADVGKFKFTQ